MDERLCIYIDRLRNGQIEQIDESIEADFLDLSDDEIIFKDKITVSGQAYLAEDKLVFHFDVITSACCRCIICNENVVIPILIKNSYSAEEIKDVKGAVFDLKQTLRDLILLEVPAYVECNQGQCPARDQISPFLKKGEPSNENHPFSDLSLKINK